MFPWSRRPRRPPEETERVSISRTSSETCSGPSRLSPRRRPLRGRPSREGGSDLGDEALTDLFREFQKGVDKQLGKEDYETRYNLGIAYKEMGLVDEAVAEFQLAAKDENRLLECASNAGDLLHREGDAQARREVV